MPLNEYEKESSIIPRRVGKPWLQIWQKRFAS